MDWGPLVRDVGVPVAILIASLVGGYKRLWMFTWAHREIVDIYKEQLADSVKRENDWKDMAIRGTMIAERQAKRRRVTD